MERALLPPLPGYLGAGPETRRERSELMTFDELVGVLREGIDSWNQSHIHPVLGCTLAEAWTRDATPIRTVAEERLRWMMLAEDRRTVQKEGCASAARYDRTLRRHHLPERRQDELLHLLPAPGRRAHRGLLRLFY